MPHSPEPSRTDFRLDVQGLRTVAVLLVVLYHANVSALSGGFVGVDVFFVISGYLITSHLLRSLQGRGIKILDFFARRLRRLAPASILVVVVTLIASLLWLPPLRMLAVFQEAAASLAYVPNLWFAVTGTDYGHEPFPSPFQQYWSLGLEEQFYLIWPFLVLLLWKMSRKSVSKLFACIALIAVLSLSLSVVFTPTYEVWSFFTLPTRAWEFAAGGLVAVAVTRWNLAGWAFGKSAAVLSWASLILVLTAGVLLNSSTPYPGYAALLPVAGIVGVLLFSSDANAWGAGQLLKTRPMTWIGDRSYSIYLWHWPLIIIPVAVFGDLPVYATLLLAGASVLLADLTYRYVENPLRTSGRLRSVRPTRFVPAALVVTASLAVAVLVAGFVLQNRPLASNLVAEPLASSAAPSLTSFVPVNTVPKLIDANSDFPEASKAGCSPGTYESELTVCEYGVGGADQTIALFGDSHAAQWFPALERLAEIKGARLLVMIKSGCASVDVPRYDGSSVDPFCESWRDQAIKYIVANQVDEVYLSNLSHRQGPVEGQLVPSEQWQVGTAAVLAALEASSVTVIQDTPWFEESPVQCASKNLDDLDPCFYDRASLIDSKWTEAERQAVAQYGQRYLSLNDLVCPDDHCGPYMGDTVVFRDAHHLTATFVASRADEFAGALAG